METLEEMIQRHEGYNPKPYQDTLGVWTVGYGHNLNKPLSHAACVQIFQDDLADAQTDCLHAFHWFADLTDARQYAMIDLCFNLGLTRLQKFVKFLAAMQAGDYETAAHELLNSVWASQVKGRANDLAFLIRGADVV